MISVEEALEKVLSDIDVPPLSNAAMDGYAVRSADTLGVVEDSPRVLRVIGEVAAGEVADQEVRPATAMRIMTGAPIPQGADSVVPFEETDEVERKAAGQTFGEIGLRCE